MLDAKTFKLSDIRKDARIYFIGIGGISMNGLARLAKHAGFVVNNGGTARASDVMRLIDYVVEKVFENSGVRLEKEVRLVGNFGG